MSAAETDFERLAAFIEDDYGVTVEALRSPARDTRTTFARRVLAICLRECGYSYPEIAESMERNHTTILRLCKGDPVRHAIARVGYTRASAAQAAADHAERVEERLRTARAEAERVLVEVPTVMPRTRPRRNVPPALDLGRMRYDAAVAAYHAALPYERERIWLDYCRREFPYSHAAQAAMLPRGAR